MFTAGHWASHNPFIQITDGEASLDLQFFLGHEGLVDGSKAFWGCVLETTLFASQDNVGTVEQTAITVTYLHLRVKEQGPTMCFDAKTDVRGSPF